jgi:hypothetical protein
MSTKHEKEVERIASLMHRPVFEAVGKASDPIVGVEALAFLFATVAIGSRPLNGTFAEAREFLLVMVAKEIDDAISAEVDDQPAG